MSDDKRPPVDPDAMAWAIEEAKKIDFANAPKGKPSEVFAAEFKALCEAKKARKS